MRCHHSVSSTWIYAYIRQRGWPTIRPQYLSEQFSSISPKRNGLDWTKGHRLTDDGETDSLDPLRRHIANATEIIKYSFGIGPRKRCRDGKRNMYSRNQAQDNRFSQIPTIDSWTWALCDRTINKYKYYSVKHSKKLLLAKYAVSIYIYIYSPIIRTYYKDKIASSSPDACVVCFAAGDQPPQFVQHTNIVDIQSKHATRQTYSW